jgi:L-fuculose-phosphate aldolase
MNSGQDGKSGTDPVFSVKAGKSGTNPVFEKTGSVPDFSAGAADSALDDPSLRARVLAAARQMNALGINRGKSGNVSARARRGDRDGYCITPTGLAYADTHEADLVWMPVDGDESAAIGRRAPSSEWRFHRDLYAARADAGAIVHTHSPFATTLACMGRGIPAFHYMIAMAGGTDIRCAPYATFGTQALSDHAVSAMHGRRACLLANHGQIALGATVEQALALAAEVETLAEMYWRALQIGEPVLLDAAEMEVVLQKFQHYGQPRQK